MHLKNKSNEYADSLPHYDKIPKTVLAAIAVSFATQIAGSEGAVDEIFREWQILHSNGIVPQKPITLYRA